MTGECVPVTYLLVRTRQPTRETNKHTAVELALQGEWAFRIRCVCMDRVPSPLAAAAGRGSPGTLAGEVDG